MNGLTIENGYGDAMTISTEFGATLTSLKLLHQDIIKYPLHEADPKKAYPSALLFPFANRIKDGIYTFKNQTYRLLRNESGRNHAIHGFVAYEPFKLIAQDTSSATFMYAYEGYQEGYPFPFELTVCYKLQKHKLKLAYNIKNTGKEPMPCSFGWHPYFVLPDTKVSDWELSLPERLHVELDANMIPQDQRKGWVNPEVKSLKNAILDDVFKLDVPGAKSAEVSIADQAYKLTVKQTTGNQKLNYIVLYIPPQRNCLAIEPHTSNIDAFNNQEGLVVLAAGKSTKGTIEVSLQKNKLG